VLAAHKLCLGDMCANQAAETPETVAWSCKAGASSGPERPIINTSLGRADAQRSGYQPTPARMMFSIISDAITAANEALHGQPTPLHARTGSGPDGVVNCLSMPCNILRNIMISQLHHEDQVFVIQL
jgi:hypothetical protein